MHQLDIDEFLELKELLELYQFFGGFARGSEVDELRNLFIYRLPGLYDVDEGFGVVLFLDVDDRVPEISGLSVFFEVDWVLFDEVPLLEICIGCSGKLSNLLVGF